MGLFKKNSAKHAASAPAPAQAKKKKSDLFKVLDESVWESVHEDFKANKQFIIKDDEGNTKYVALLFDTTQVGGLAGKDAKKDESKGSIIEAIRTGRIKSYIRNEMLADEAFVIIPDMETIDNMNEFNLFVNVDYIVCTVDTDGIVNTETINGTDAEDDPELTVSFKTLQELIATNGDVKSLFNTKPIGFMAAAAPAPVDISDFDDYPEEDVETLSEDLENSPDDFDDDYSDVQSTQGFTQVPPVQQTTPQAPPVQQPVYQDDGYEDYEDETPDDGGYDEYEDITEDIVHDFVVRKFYSDDLGLEVSTQPFDAQFLHGNSYLPFNENRGSGWLNEYLSNFAKDANTRMERLHNENLFRMRERYMRLIQGHCASIVKSLDISDDSTQYGKMRYAIEQNKMDNLDMLDQSIAEKREQLETSWEAKLEQVGNEAAAAAKQQYIDRYGRTHDNDIFNLEIREKDEIERDYQNSLKRMNDDRRDEASKLLDLAISETLKEMSALYLKVLRDEKKEYTRLQNEMTRFIDDNRKDEKARIDALAENNRQIKKADEVRRDYTAKIKALSAEFDTKKIMLQADIDRMQREHDIELKNYQAEFNTKLDEEKQKSAQLQSQLDELLQKYADLDEKKRSEYENRMNEYEQRIKQFDVERQDNISREAHIIESHKRANLASVFLVIAILIAALGIGFMVGSVVNVRRTSEIEQQNVYQSQQFTPSTSVTDEDENSVTSVTSTDNKDKSDVESTHKDTTTTTSTTNKPTTTASTTDTDNTSD